jgi:uncharacterized membrane protein YqiK
MNETKETKKGTLPVKAGKAAADEKAGLMVSYERRGAALLKTAEALVEVVDDVTRAKASELRVKALAQVKEIEEEFGPDVKKAHSLWQDLKARVNRLSYFPNQVKALVEKRMSDYDLKKIKEANEAKAKADRDKAELDRKERERLLRQAEAAKEKGKEEKAAILEEQAAMVNNFVPAAETGPERMIETKSGKTTSFQDFNIEVENPAIFLREVVVGREEWTLVVEKPGPLKEYAKRKQIGDELPVIPGCRITPKMSYRNVSTGSGR